MADAAWENIRKQVYQRANGCCEYCQTSELSTGQTMQVDHIQPKNGDDFDNLCLSCWNCNNHKRTVTTFLDTITGQLVRLFNPRQDKWDDHFRWIDGYTHIESLTAIGRVTIDRLKMNRPSIVVARRRWVEGGYHPPN